MVKGVAWKTFYITVMGIREVRKGNFRRVEAESELLKGFLKYFEFLQFWANTLVAPEKTCKDVMGWGSYQDGVQTNEKTKRSTA